MPLVWMSAALAPFAPLLHAPAPNRTQGELIGTAEELLRNNTVAVANQSTAFSLLTHETTDISWIQLLSLGIRIYYGPLYIYYGPRVCGQTTSSSPFRRGRKTSRGIFRIFRPRGNDYEISCSSSFTRLLHTCQALSLNMSCCLNKVTTCAQQWLEMIAAYR